MKMDQKLRRRGRKRLWAGLIVVLALACAEIWMVCSFSRDCAQSVAQEDWGNGLAVTKDLLVSR